MTAPACSDPFASHHQWHVGPLRPHIGWFAGRLIEHGYAHATAREKLRLIAHLSRWLQCHQRCAEDLDERRVRHFLQDRRRQGRVPRSHAATLAGFLAELRAAKMLPAPIPTSDESGLQHVERRFEHSLAHARGLAPTTVCPYLPIVRGFLRARFGTGPLRLHELALHDVTRFLLRHAHTVSPRRATLLVAALRTFCRFLQHRGDIATDLAASVPPVADWRLATLPKALPPAQVERLWHSGDHHSPVGQRDDTLVLLLARLGLRPGEVVALTLDDLEWDPGTLLVCGKGGRRDRLPMPQDVGEALVTSRRLGRPHGATRRVFVWMKAPRRGFASSVALCTMVRRALRRAGLDPVCTGAPGLRHSLATQMLRNGASLAEIGDVLRHRHPQTTEMSAQVDRTA